MKNCCQKSLKSTCFKCMYGLSVYDYRVAALSRKYLTVIGTILQNLKTIGHFQPFQMYE